MHEENLYLNKSGSSHKGVFESKSESESDIDKDYVEGDGLVERDHVPPVFASFDKEDPPMTVGSKYSNIDEFKLALSYYAIKNEIEYDTEKSDPGRMILHCSKHLEDGCKWRLIICSYYG